MGTSKLRAIARVAATAAMVGAGATIVTGQSASAPRLVVLRNGHVIAGEITRASDGYHITLPNGTIRVPQRDVEFACATIEEAYREKRSRARATSAFDHLQLAKWCANNSLMEHADEHLRAARASEPNHAGITALERRLALAGGMGGAASRPPTGAHAGPTNDELDQFVKNLPSGSVETFRRVIQPLLIQRCGTARCHGAASSSTWQLLRSPMGVAPSRRTTQRNLHAVHRLLDHDDPGQSPLLGLASGTHGAAANEAPAPWTPSQYEQLAAWIQQVAGQSGSTTVAPEASEGGALNKHRPTRAPDAAEPLDPLDPAPYHRRFFPRDGSVPQIDRPSSQP